MSNIAMTVIGFLIIFASTTLGSAGDRQENIRSRQIHIDLGASVRGILVYIARYARMLLLRRILIRRLRLFTVTAIQQCGIKVAFRQDVNDIFP